MLGFIAPYTHIPFNTNDSEGIFGFKWMSSFLFATGFPVFLLSLGFLLFYASEFMPKKMDKLFRAFSFLTAFTGLFFLSWSLNPFEEKDYNPLVYYGAMIFISGVLAYSIRFYKSTVKRLITERFSFLDFLLDIKKEYKKMLKHALKPNLINDANDEVFEEIKKDSNNFDTKVYEKGKELVG